MKNEVAEIAEEALRLLEKDRKQVTLLKDYVRLSELLHEKIEKKAVEELSQEEKGGKIAWIFGHISSVALPTLLKVAAKIGVLTLIIFGLFLIVRKSIQFMKQQEIIQFITDIPGKIIGKFRHVRDSVADNVVKALFEEEMEEAARPVPPGEFAYTQEAFEQQSRIAEQSQIPEEELIEHIQGTFHITQQNVPEEWIKAGRSEADWYRSVHDFQRVYGGLLPTPGQIMRLYL